MSKRLVFFGTEDFSAPSLQKLILSVAGYDIAAVVTKPDAKSGRGQKVKAPRIKEIAQTAGLKVFQPEQIGDIADELKKLEASHGILVAYGKILPQEIIDIFPGGIINIHPSLLPKYRGPSPIEAAILNGDKTTGVSLMSLSAKMDAGPVYAQVEVEMPPEPDRILMGSLLAEHGANLLMNNLDKILRGELPATPQDESKATYTKLLKKSDGLIDLTKPAEVLEREVRAYLGWPKSQIKIYAQPIIVTKASLTSSASEDEVILQAKHGYLRIDELIAPSGRRMTGPEFIRGYKR